MIKLMQLLRVQLWAVLGDILSIGKSVKKKPRLLYAGVLFFVLVMSGISFFYSFMMGKGLELFGCLELLPLMMMAVVSIIILMTTIFKVKGTIFGFRDYDMVMSLPVSTGTIIACRLLILYALNFMFVIIMILPMMIVYGVLAHPGVLFYVLGILLMFFIPLFPIVAASILGTIIAYAASKFKHNNVLNIILTMGLLIAFMVLSSSVSSNNQEMYNISKALTGRINSIYPLAAMYTEAILHYNILALLEFLGISLAVFLLYVMIVTMIFKRLNTLMLTGRANANYKLGELKTSSPWKALYLKELKRYFASSLYVLNTGFGIVLLTFAAVASLFVDIHKLFNGPATAVFSKQIPLMISFCIVMTYTSAASISLEGRNLWIIKSMPVTPKQVFLSKIAVNLTIIAPAVLDAILIGIGLKLGFLEILMLVMVVVACALFVSFLGLFINILLPNFNWTSEVVIIKQSAASIICIFTAMAYVGIEFVFLFFSPSFLLGSLGFCVLTAIIDLMLYRLIMTYGKKRYFSF